MKCKERSKYYLLLPCAPGALRLLLIAWFNKTPAITKDAINIIFEYVAGSELFPIAPSCSIGRMSCAICGMDHETASTIASRKIIRQQEALDFRCIDRYYVNELLFFHHTYVDLARYIKHDDIYDALTERTWRIIDTNIEFSLSDWVTSALLGVETVSEWYQAIAARAMRFPCFNFTNDIASVAVSIGKRTTITDMFADFIEEKLHDPMITMLCKVGEMEVDHLNALLYMFCEFARKYLGKSTCYSTLEQYKAIVWDCALPFPHQTTANLVTQ